MKAENWIDQVKAAKGLSSDYAAAKALGISRATISKYRSTTPTLDEENAIKIAHALGMNPAGIIVDQVAERSKSAEVRAALSKEVARLCILC